MHRPAYRHATLFYHHASCRAPPRKNKRELANTNLRLEALKLYRLFFRLALCPRAFRLELRQPLLRRRSIGLPPRAVVFREFRSSVVRILFSG